MLKTVSIIIDALEKEGKLEKYIKEIDCSPTGDAIYLIPKDVKENNFGKIPGKIKFTEFKSTLNINQHLCVYLSSDVNGLTLYKESEKNIEKLNNLYDNITNLQMKCEDGKSFCETIMNLDHFMNSIFKNILAVYEENTNAYFNFEYEEDKYLFRLSHNDYMFFAETNDLLKSIDEVIEHIRLYSRSIKILIEILMPFK